MALYLLYRGIRNRRYFAGLARAPGLPSRFHSDDGQRSHLVSRGIGGRGSLFGRTDPRSTRRASPNAVVCIDHHARRPRYGGSEAGGISRRRLFRAARLSFGRSPCAAAAASGAVVVLETEIWPNLYRESKRAGARADSGEWPHFRSRPAALPPLELVFPPRVAMRRHDFRAERRRRASLRHGRRAFGSCTSRRQPEVRFHAAVLRCRAHHRRISRPDETKQIWIAASTMPPADSTDVDEDDEVLMASRKSRGPAFC